MIPPKIDYIYIITYFQKSITYQPLFKTEPKIKELRASGLSYRAIVKEIGLSTCTIQRALKGIYD